MYFCPECNFESPQGGRCPQCNKTLLNDDEDFDENGTGVEEEDGFHIVEPEDDEM